MSKFIQIHLLTSYAPANLNRDDMGRPKTAHMGGRQRLRISSQSLKRAWRTSELFEESLAGHIGTRTKLIGVEVYNKLIENDIKTKDAKNWSKSIANQFGKLKNKAKEEKLQVVLEIEQLVHISPEEHQAIMRLADTLISENRAPEENELSLLRENIKAADIALFGRMLASSPGNNFEAAAQVAHALTVHQVTIEDDYFTAVDDLNSGEEDSGSAHIGEMGFGAGVFYNYICINRDLLLKNLQSDEELTAKSISALTKCAAEIAPSGKQNSYASRARSFYVMVEKGTQQPRQLSSAFLDPVPARGNMMETAISRLKTLVDNMDKVYDPCADERYEINVDKGEGRFIDLLEFAAE